MGEPVVDLHIHSCFSDGTYTPEEIVALALQKGVGVIAVTDHNQLAGARQAVKLGSEQLRVIPGVELDGSWKGEDIHILGYGVDLYDAAFETFVDLDCALMEQMDTELIRRVGERDPRVSVEAYEAYSYDRTLGGWKALHYFIDSGVAADADKALTLFVDGGNPYPSVETVVDAIHAAGGKAVLAHPGKCLATAPDAFCAELEAFIQLGIDGIECFYPSHSKTQTDACLACCRKHGLLITAGSDCHGGFQKTAIGQTQTPLHMLHIAPLL